MDRVKYDEVIQVTCTPAQKKVMESIAAVRHPRRSRVHNIYIPNLAAACREAFAEYIMRHKEEVQ